MEKYNKLEKNPKTEAEQIRSRAVLLCPDNDAEADMILTVAEKAGMSVIRSQQPHGANLSLEPDLELKLSEFKKPEIWIVETPGLEKEGELTSQGFDVKIIDHHTYQNIDRLTDSETGNKKLSSLEQFLAMAKIRDDEMEEWGLNPKIVRGIGIMDARYVRGLRDAGYSKDEINQVFELKRKIIEKIQPEFDKLLKLAKEDWENRTEQDGYLVIESEHGGDIRGAITEVSILHDMDTVPMVISVDDGKKITVQNITPEIVEKLNQNIKGHTYTFGSGLCWGLNNKDKNITLKEILDVLGNKD